MSLIRRYALPLSLLAVLMLMIAAPYLIPENPDSAVFRSGTLGAILIAGCAFPSGRPFPGPTGARWQAASCSACCLPRR